MSHSEPVGFSRRAAVKLGLCAGAAGIAGATPALLRAAAAPGPLITKAIPSTGERLPVVGVGTTGFNLSNIATVQTMLRRMHDLGGSVIDTAAAYGESEAAIGTMLDNLKLREKFFLASKLIGVAPSFGPPPPAPAGAAGAAPRGGRGGMIMDGVMGERSFERSLERLKTGRLDLLMVHNMTGVNEVMPQLQDWKQAGRIRYLGISAWVNNQHAQMMELMRKYPLDFIQVNYSLDNRAAEPGVFTLAQERKVAVIANVPFGGLGGRTLATASGRPLPPWAADIGCTSWSQFLLKFVVSHPAVTVTIPGSTKIEHLESNQLAGRGELVSAAIRRRMQEYWDAAG